MQLPRFIFLNGPKGVGKTTLATMLCREDAMITRIQFIEPINTAMSALFYPEELLTVGFDGQDKKNEPLPSPFDAWSHRGWQLEFGKFLRQTHGEEVLGRFAFKTCQANDYYYKHFILDGARLAPEIEPFLRNARESCMIVRLYRPGHDWKDDLGDYLHPTRVTSADLVNDKTPADLLAAFKSYLPVPQTPVEQL